MAYNIITKFNKGDDTLGKEAKEILASYKRRFNLLFEEMELELLKITGSDESFFDEVPLGEARKVAILTESLDAEEKVGLMRHHLSFISQKYGRKPATCGVFFRPDVNLMETRYTNNQRFVTDKGKLLVARFKQKYGENWIEENIDVLKDKNLIDTFTLKMRLREGGLDNE